MTADGPQTQGEALQGGRSEAFVKVEYLILLLDCLRDW